MKPVIGAIGNFGRKVLNSEVAQNFAYRAGRLGGAVLGAGLGTGADDGLQKARTQNVAKLMQQAQALGGRQGAHLAMRAGVNDQMRLDKRPLEGATRLAVMMNPSVTGEQLGAGGHFAMHPLTRGSDGQLEMRVSSGAFMPLHQLGNDDRGAGAALRMMHGNAAVQAFGEK
jgi:hypothetical protein